MGSSSQATMQPSGDSTSMGKPGAQATPHPQQTPGGPAQQPQAPGQQQQQGPQAQALMKQNRITPVGKPVGIDPVEVLNERENRLV